jgi:hypothetical protein
MGTAIAAAGAAAAAGSGFGFLVKTFLAILSLTTRNSMVERAPKRRNSPQAMTHRPLRSALRGRPALLASSVQTVRMMAEANHHKAMPVIQLLAKRR